MTVDVVVFLGPTLNLSDARDCLDAKFLPPAGAGDIAKAVILHTPAMIALIDGVFGESPAVRHKEILWALSRGVRVFGASSMGAVRAAELADYGMVGHGLVFRWYRRTLMADDADVAVPMAPAELGSRALGDAMIDIRLTLKRAERESVIGSPFRLALERWARSIHYTERSYRTILALAAKETAFAQELGNLDTWLAEGVRQQKRTDAVGLLSRLSSREVSLTEKLPVSGYEMTETFAADMQYYELLDIMLSGDPG